VQAESDLEAAAISSSRRERSDRVRGGRCGGASRKGEFGQCGEVEMKILPREARPDRVEGLEPVEEVGVCAAGTARCEGLVK